MPVDIWAQRDPVPSILLFCSFEWHPQSCVYIVELLKTIQLEIVKLCVWGQGKSLLGTSTSHTWLEFLATVVLTQLLSSAHPKKQQVLAHACHPCGGPRWGARLLAPAKPCCGDWQHLEREPMGRRSLFLYLSLWLSNKKENECFKKKHLLADLYIIPHYRKKKK